MPPASRLAPAKINLTLHVTGQRPDGYHTLDSLVVFAEAGDHVTLSQAQGLSLTLDGPHAAGLAGEGDNLILRAARSMAVGDAAFHLTKHLPVASGMGGGSSDAAAALHLLAGALGQPLPPVADLMRLGADLPVCIQAPHPARMQGLGEVVARVDGVPALWLLLVNPGQGLSTPSVFKALIQKDNAPMPDALPHWRDAGDLCQWLASQRNDLQAPASAVMPSITALLAQIAAQPGCLLARMTGSGATCYGVFADARALNAADSALAAPGRFVLSTRSVASPS